MENLKLKLEFMGDNACDRYNVYLETMRRALILVEDMEIVEVVQGSAIIVKFIKRFRNLNA